MKTVIKYSLCVALLLGAWHSAWAQDEPDYAFDSVAVAVDDIAITSAEFNQWNNSEPFVNGVEALNNDEEFEVAAGYFEQELKLHPTNGYALCNLSLCKSHLASMALNESICDILDMQLSNTDEAEELYQIERSKYFNSLGEVIDILNRGIALLPADDKESTCKAYISLAKTLDEAERDDDSVIDAYKKAIAVHPCDESITEFVTYARSNGHDKEAIDVVLSNKDLPDIPSVKILLAQAAYDNGNYREVLNVLHGLSTGDIDAQTIALMGESCYMLGDVDKALALMDKAIRQNAVNDEVSFFLITRKIALEMDNGMVDKVLHDAQVAEILCAGSEMYLPAVYSAQGWAYGVKNKWSDAIASYEKWSNLDEDNYSPRYWAAKMMLLSGDINQGRNELTKILDNADFSSNQELKMNVLTALGRKAEAKEILDLLARNTDQQKAMKAESLTEVMSLYNLACAYSLLGEKNKALDYLRLNYETLDDDPNFEYALLDRDFDSMRKNAKFQKLINDYKLLWKNGNLKPKK